MTSIILTLAKHLKSNADPFNPERNLITGPEWFKQCKKVKVLDSQMSYYDSGKNSNEAIIFLHGNPTSSYLWRNIIPHVTDEARCLAPDLIGMGQSGKSGSGTYRFVDHYKYLSAWFDLVDLPEKVVVVCHDWGSGLGFHWCHMNIARVKALVHMESVVCPIMSWKVWPDLKMLQLLRTDAGEELVLKKNVFIERMLPWSMMRQLETEEMEAYRAPYKEKGESRRPTLTWPREVPLENEGPDDVLKIIMDFQEFFKTTPYLPKLFIDSDPGLFSNSIREFALEWPNTETVKVKGLHFPQEDSPDETGSAILSFVKKLDRQLC